MSRLLVAAGLSVSLAACATKVPNIYEAGGNPDLEVNRQGNLVAHVRCELTQALFQLERDEETIEAYRQAQIARGETPAPAPRSTRWLEQWGSRVTLKVQVEEGSVFAPSITLFKNRPNKISTFAEGGNVTFGRSSTLPLSVSTTAKATRTEQIGFYFPFADLKKDAEDDWEARAKAAFPGQPYDARARKSQRDTYLASKCPASDGVRLEGDLKIGDFIRTKVRATGVQGVIPGENGKSPFDTFTYEINFLITNGAGAAPSWKLYPVSINQAANLFSGSRTKSNGLLLTLGKVENGKAAQEAEQAHFARLIGLSVADAIGKPTP